jgi:hypothetical protein
MAARQAGRQAVRQAGRQAFGLHQASKTSSLFVITIHHSDESISFLGRRRRRRLRRRLALTAEEEEEGHCAREDISTYAEHLNSCQRQKMILKRNCRIPARLQSEGISKSTCDSRNRVRFIAPFKGINLIYCPFILLTISEFNLGCCFEESE